MKYRLNERVCFYDKGERFVGNIKYCHKDNTYNIETRFCLFVVHEKQIRKLKPKKKPREWWLKFNTSNYTITFNNETFYSAVQVVSVKPHNLDGWIHVKEVLK